MRNMYSLGDAQIDAQNRVTEQIGDVLVQFNAMKAAGTLSAASILSFMNQVQSLIDNYAAQFGGTSRGEAGRVTLQTFVDQNIFPEWNNLMTSLSTNTGYSQSLISIPTIPNGPAQLGPGSTTNINVAPGASSTPGAYGPSYTPGPPSGISIPGTETTVNASLPFDWTAYALPAAIGVALWFVFGRKGNT